MSSNKTARAVIGANYGDEGKGLMTDYLATPKTLVVRSNGGAQAGHTVTTPDRRRHVFHHIGSGAFAGGATHLSQFFVAHPMFFAAERRAMLSLGGNVDVSIDPRAAVTTPYDILINQAAEKARAGGRHGSTGFGFGETIERSLDPAYATPAGDLSRADLGERLDRIRREWLPRRLLALGVKRLDEEDQAAWKSDAVLERFLQDVEEFRRTVGLRDDAGIGRDGEDVLFEGAQGLQLDQDYGAFPHVTRSNTGLVNMAAIAKEAGIDHISATYVTRAYLTRHGAGPLPYEGWLSGVTVVDETNVPNDWQGSLRLAPLDIDVVAKAIRHDVRRAEGAGVSVDKTLAITCLDQIDRRVSVMDERMVSMEPDRLVAVLSEAASIWSRGSWSPPVESWGPTRATIRVSQTKIAALNHGGRTAPGAGVIAAGRPQASLHCSLDQSPLM